MPGEPTQGCDAWGGSWGLSWGISWGNPICPGGAGGDGGVGRKQHEIILAPGIDDDEVLRVFRAMVKKDLLWI